MYSLLRKDLNSLELLHCISLTSIHVIESLSQIVYEDSINCLTWSHGIIGAL